MAAVCPLPSVFIIVKTVKVMRATVSAILLLMSFGLLAWAGGCRRQDDSETSGPQQEVALAPYQGQLLDIAFAAASAMPLEPHIKNRSRAQENVVAVSLELNQPERAERYIEQIANWRRGAGYADLAFCYARQGATEKVEPCLKRASEVLNEAEGWRRDRIKAKIAATRVYLGQSQVRAVLRVAAGEWGPVTRAEAMTCSEEGFETNMAALEKLASAEGFESAKDALGACVELYGRFYAAAPRRSRAEACIKASWAKLPVFVRIDFLREMADASLAHADFPKALELVDQAKGMMDSTRWEPQAVIPLMAQLAERRFRAGDEAGARAQVQAALELFDAKRQTIVNIYRAQTLRPIAEALHVMGDSAAAIDLYKRAVEAGIENPNSRPRVDDLVATCCSMASHAVEPDAALLGRIQEIQAGLDDPW